MAVEYKNEVADVELENGEVLDAVARDSQFGKGVIPTLNEQDESHEWEEVERRSCTVVEVSPLLILKPDTRKPTESETLTITIAEKRNYKFYVGQKVWYITYRRERPATLEEKQHLHGIETAIDFNYVTKPIDSEK